jgi:hypothetical protein
MMKVRPRKFIAMGAMDEKDLFSGSPQCLKCRGTKLLCGKEQCPILVKFYSMKSLALSNQLEGSSPPSVFIGRYGYPKVNIGPMIPPRKGDTSLIATPERWIGKSIDEIVNFRSQLVRGKYPINVKKFDDRIANLTREMALSKKSVDAEVEFEKIPRGFISLYDDLQPHGPSGKIKDLDIDNPKFDHLIERAFYDTDLVAKDAVIELYENGALISSIQKAFSVGAFGLGKERKFVPTRWSITAVDSMIGEKLAEEVKKNPLINEYRVYKSEQFDNRWAILMMPTSWRYESIEAWFPSTTWNPSKKKIVIYGDHEFYDGKKEYATIGGCYYAARLAVSEKLNEERRQAGVVVLREIHPGYIMPVGVWNVRENVRNALRKKPRKFDSLSNALLSISESMDIPIKEWIDSSAILTNLIRQSRIEDFHDYRRNKVRNSVFSI